MRLAILTVAAATLASAQSGGGYLIATVVDAAGTLGFSGDGGAAASAQLNFPTGLAVDAAGNLFIADTFNNRIRKVSPNGTIATVAGAGVRGFGGDGGPATSAKLNYPQAVAVDLLGNLFIADTGNLRIRKVSPGGTITTIAGVGAQGADGDGGPAAAAQLSNPKGLAVDSSGSLFIADTGNQRIRKVWPDGTIVTVAGSGTQGPADDGGPATAAQLYNPVGIALDPLGNLYIACTSDPRIRKVTARGIISTVAGSVAGFAGDGGPATSARLDEPWGVAFDASGNLLIADAGNQRIRKVSPDGIIATIGGTGNLGNSGDGGPAAAAQLDVLFAIAVDANGNVFASTGNRVRELLSPQLSPGCSFSIDPSQQAFATPGGSASVSIAASAPGCPWRAISLANWITVSGGGAGIGSSLLTYSVARNPYSADRSTSLWIGGEFLTVTQAGLTCSLTLASRSFAVSAFGFAGTTIPLTFNSPDCQWNATTSVPWILLGSASRGTGNGTVAFSVGINTGPARTGAILIAGRNVYVNQPGQGETVDSLAAIADGGVGNAASGATVIAGGSFVSVYGRNFADSSVTWDSAIPDGKTLPTSVGGVQVLINGRKAFVSFVSPGQVNVLAPPDNTTGPVDIDVATPHGTATATGTLAAVSPALIAFTSQGKVYPVAFFANQDVEVGASGFVADVPSRPAAAGDYLTLYATGLGPTNPPYPPGQVLTGVYPVADLSQVQITLGGLPAKILFAGMTFAGVFQINLQVPAGIGSGELPVVLKFGTQTSPQATVLPFQ